MSPGKSRKVTLIVAVAVLALLIIVMMVVFVINRDGPTSPPNTPTTPAATGTATAPTQPSASVSSPASQQPLPPAIATKYFINAEAEGVVYAAGIKIKGDQVSGWAGALRSSDVTCFNGHVSGGRLSGTLWSHADEGGGPLVSQRFAWRVSGSGDQLKLLEVSSITPLTEVPVGRVNQDAALPANSDWQSTFNQCAKLTGGLS